MRKTLLMAVAVCGIQARAQMGGPAAGGGFGGGLDQLFNSNPVFTATMQGTIPGPTGSITTESKVYYDHGNFRTDVNMSDAQGGGLPPQAIAQAQAMGMDQVIMISPASKTNSFMIYPKLKAYLAMPASNSSTTPGNVQITKIGNDTIDGHACVENKVDIAFNGETNEFTVWNATDMKNFPIKISNTEQGTSSGMTFKNISFGAVDASMFQPPTGDKQYNSIQELLQAVMASHAGEGVPAPAPPPGQ